MIIRPNCFILEQMQSSFVIGASFLAYTLAIVFFGVYTSRYAKRSSADFFLAERGLGAWVASISASASSESGWVMLGLVGEAFHFGVATYWVTVGCLAGYLFNWLFLSPRVRKASFADDSITFPDLLAERFDTHKQTIRLVAVIVITLSMLGYVAAQFNAAGKAFAAVFDTSYSVGVLAGAAIVLLYTVSGGFRAVAWTDLVQGILMALALVILPILTIIHVVAEKGAFFDILSAQDPLLLDITSQKYGFAALGVIIGFLGIGLGYPGQPHVVVRFMASKTEEQLKRSALISFVWGFLVYNGAITLGIAARALYGSMGDPEQALPIAAAQMLPGVIAGLMLAAVLAAICSTADSQLIVAASGLAYDLYEKLLGKKTDEKTLIWINRTAVLLIGGLALLFAQTENRVVFHFVLYAWSGLGAGFGPAVILIFFWRKTTSQGVIAGMIVGLVATIVWKNIPIFKSALYELVPAFALAFLAIYLVSLVTRSEKNVVRRNLHYS
ncbi:MAG: sodium/proline symporter PutP [Myxococcota bacterium]